MSGRGSHGTRKPARGRLVKKGSSKRHHATRDGKKGLTVPEEPQRRNMFFAAFTRLAAGREEPADSEAPKASSRAGGKKPKLQGDEASQQLQKSGVYHIRDKDAYAKNDAEGPKFNSPVTYSFWSGAKFCLLLSLFLWWFPLVGNMIAGYIGGRRAGGPWRGVFACILPVIVLMILTYGHEHGLLPAFIVFIIQIPEMARQALVSDLPAAAPYYGASVIYVTGFVGYLSDLLRFQMNLYVVTILFGYVGGAVAEMRQAEYAFGASSSNSNSNSNVTVNVNHGRGGSESEVDDGIPSGSRSSGASDSDSLPSHSRPLPPVSVADAGFQGGNWRRRKLRGEGRESRDPKVMGAQARLKRGSELDAETGPRGEILRDSIFRLDGPAVLAKKRATTGDEDEAGEEGEYRTSRSSVRAQSASRSSPGLGRASGPSRDNLQRLEREGEELTTRRAGGHQQALTRAAHPHAEEPHGLPARAVRKVAKLERRSEDSGSGAVTRLHRAEPNETAASASRLFKERRAQAVHAHEAAQARHAHHADRDVRKRGEDEDDDDGPVKGTATEEEAGGDKRKDEIQKLVERALKGTGPTTFGVKKEQEHNWEVL